jgi:phosphatidate cytidylyltransferase
LSIAPGGTAAWRDLRIRAASAIVLGLVSLAAIWIGGLAWQIWLTVLAVGLGAEWAGLCGERARSEAGAFIILGLVLSGLAAILGSPTLALVLLVSGSAFLALATRRPGLPQGILYIGPAYLSLLMMRTGPHGLRNVLFVMAVVWSTDIGAYLVGRWMGGPRLAPKISPGKTWSGAAGGAALAILAGAAAGHENPGLAAAMALALSVVAQAGDLLESAIKRHFGAKDSGWIIPGHGGLLDRLDGLLAAAPLAMLWSLMTGAHALMWQ